MGRIVNLEKVIQLLVILILASAVVYAQVSQPISGASVVAYGDAGYGVAETDVGGSFRIVEGLGEGTYNVEVSAKGYVSKIVQNVRVTADRETDIGDVFLEPSAVIKGVVRTPKGNPAAYVPVALKDRDGSVLQLTFASGDGSFIFDTNVRNGTYTIEAYAFLLKEVEYQKVTIGFTQITIPIPKRGVSYLEGYTSGKVEGIKAVQGETVEGLVITLGVSGIISGRVTDDQGNPVANVLVIAFPPSEDMLRGFYAVTDKNGRYRIANNLDTGDYNVTLIFPKGYVWNFMNAKTVHVVAGSETANVDFQLERSGIISGVVVYSDGTPAANVSVVAFSKEGKYFGFTISELNGSFRIDSGLGTGTYQVMAFTGVMVFSEPVIVQVTAGEETKNVKLILPGPARRLAAIEGRVTDVKGNPVEDAEVSALGTVTQTAEDGSYRLVLTLQDVTSTVVTVTASKTGYNTVTKENVKVTVGETTKPIDFTLEKLRIGVIKGRVLAKAPPPPIKKTASLSMSLSSYTVSVGESVTISGVITPALTGEVSILIASDNVFEEVSKVALKDGSFEYSFTPAAAGTYRVKASWPGNVEYNPAETSVLTLTVRKISPTVEISVSKTTANIGETVTVSGSISPFIAETDVVIVVTSPSAVNEYTVSSSDGSFEYSLALDIQGAWSVKARVPEGPVYELTESDEVQITVQEKKCIIATVTFGSEVAPEVDFLRSFRDCLILTTYAGRQFYVAFNAFYYSWSTPVAGFIESNPVLKPIVKAMLYPLLGILSFTALVSTPIFELNIEAAVLAGFIASSLIGAIYVSPVLIAISFLARKYGKRVKPSMSFVKSLWVLTAVFLVLIGLGLALESDLLLIVATSAYVIFTIASSSTSILYLVDRRVERN